MGIFDSLKDSLGNSLKQQVLERMPGGADNPMVQAAVGAIEQQGGIGALAQRFHEQGLGGVVQSWISTGQNQPIDPQQIQNVLGSGQLEQLAERFGIPKETVANGLSQILPQVVDKMTPNGQVPQQ
jgi:uncharacterized protein YidB (DUF937 family)